MSVPRVSVLLPVGPREIHLGDAMRSIEAQSLRDFEGLLVLDGTEESTRRIARDRARRDPRWRILESSDRGLVPALQCGLREARATYLARFDADDLAHPQRLERQVTFLEEHPEIEVLGTRWHLLTDGIPGGGYQRYQAWQESLLTPEDLRRERFYESPLAHPTICLRTTTLRTLGGYRDLGWPEDYDLWLRYLADGPVLAVLDQDLHAWRDRPERHSRTHPRYSPGAFLRCKAHHLARASLPRQDLWIWGAGPIGTRLARWLREEGVSPTGFVDIDPRKIGNTRGGLPILAPDEALARRPRLLLAAVGGEGSNLLRAHLLELGLRPGVDFLRVA